MCLTAEIGAVIFEVTSKKINSKRKANDSCALHEGILTAGLLCEGVDMFGFVAVSPR